MSYQVLARKWRPTNFSQVAGQAHVLKSLINALDNGRLHHAYLFTGTRGVGKTTLARILAKCLNCESGVTSKPCEVCGSCLEISQGRFVDLIEVDAASRTKVEDTRELLDNVQYTPSRGRFKVYLIDEVHMLSSHSFNALLKTLEEPPPHVKFLFATTDPQKLPVTVLSRCLQFSLKNLTPQQITEHLIYVLQHEAIEFAEDALWQIAAAANGSMRDALTLVDQAIAYCQGMIATEGVVEMLGIPAQQKIFSLLNSMSKGDVREVYALVQEIAEHTPDYVHTLESLLSVLHRVAIAQVIPDAIDNSLGDKSQLHALAAALTPEDVQLYYQMGLKGREDLRYAADSRAAFEMLIVRMLVFSPNYVHVQGTILAPASNPITPVIEKKKSSSGTTSPIQIKPVAKTGNPGSKPPQSERISVNADLASAQDQSKRAQVQQMTHQRWLEIFNSTNFSGIVGNVLGNSELIKADDATLHFMLDQNQSAVFSPELVPKLQQALADYFETEITVQISLGEVTSETPAILSQRLKQERHQEMIQEFEQDENVQELVRHFSGSIAKDSIAPVKDRGNE